MSEKNKCVRFESRLKTKEKRKSQDCFVYELKFDKSHLSKEKINRLERMFLEAKWLYNAIIADGNIFEFDTKIKDVSCFDKDGNKKIESFEFLSAQMKQSIKERLKRVVLSLSTAKNKNGDIVGKIKFKKEVNSIPLRQFGITHQIKDKNHIRLEKYKKWFKVIGLDQIPEKAEFANANLIKKAGDYYLKIVCFLTKEKKVFKNKSIGLDFGIKDNIITSDGEKLNFYFPETEKIKKLDKAISRCKRGSNRKNKLIIRRKKAHKELVNRRRDAANKFISRIRKENDYICIQNENILEWASNKKGGFSKKVNYSAMGYIIKKLKERDIIIVDKYFPSSQICSDCGSRKKIGLNNRLYKCGCGLVCDRDINSAKNILKEGLKTIGVDHINIMFDEKNSAVNVA